MINTYEYVKNYNRTQYEVHGFRFNDYKYVNAKYVHSFDVMDSGNRLIEALPPLRTEEECVNDFVEMPYWTPEVRTKNVKERMSLCSHLDDFRIPRDFTMDVDFEIHEMLLRCYRNRIPNKCPGSNGPGFYSPSGGTIPGALFLGNSGAGKTTAILHALRYYPQLIVHEMKDSRMLQIPYINVLCPPDASVKHFYDLCLDEIERIINKPITERTKRGTADTKAQIFRKQAIRYNIGLVVVDEVQNIMNVQKKTLMQHFLNLSNELSVPFLFVGTNKVRDFFMNEEFYIKRRTGVLLEANHFEKDTIWENFLKKLWKFQWTKEVISYSQEFSDVFFRETAGNIDRVKELYMISQKEAIKNGFDTVELFTPTFIEGVSHKYFNISYKELNKSAEIPTAIKAMLLEDKTFHEKEKINSLIMNAGTQKELNEELKYRVIESVGSFSNGRYSLQEIEKAFFSVSKDIDLLETEESILCMEVLKILLQQSDTKVITKKSVKEKLSLEEMSNALPLFHGELV